MVEEIVSDLVNQMEEKKMIEESDIEYYEYALLIMAERVIAVGTMLIISIIFKQFLPTVAFLIFFLSLRKRTGGYHADKFWQCYLLTIMTYIGVVQAASVLSEKPHIMYSLLFLAVVAVEVIGAVNHPNIDFDENELRETKRAARLLVLIETGVIAVLAVFKMSQLYVSYMSIAIILCSILMCLAKMIKQEVKVR
ncbi:MAG: accessory gene regulator B family protein [bacterium]|nr:accessory gene regulator B family protein [bacterium]